MSWKSKQPSIGWTVSDEIPEDTQMESIPQSRAKENTNQLKKPGINQQCPCLGLIREPQLVNTGLFRAAFATRPQKREREEEVR